jgi:16S rRNA (guanine(1405)-N(7))-methyltransferase
VLDLGCGVHPLTLPWSTLAADVTYEGWDLDEEVCVAVERALVRSFPGVRIRPGDLLSADQLPAADLVLLLKLAPTLEHQAPDALEALTRKLRGRFVVTSWPRRSLGGLRRFAPPPDAPGEGTTITLGDEIVRIRRLAP